MAIQKRFIHFKKFSDFNSKKLSANEANTQYTVGVSGAIQDGDPDILYQSYVWIKDTKQQWTHAQLYGNDFTVDLTYEELKSLRDSAQLIPGQQYRITDYMTTTTQAGTAAAGHQFDIIVTSKSENELFEYAKADYHEGDTYFLNSNLSAWELKYTLDNDTSKYAWADATNGKGVIYYMKDEWNNECPYDFKNILISSYIFEKENQRVSVHTYLDNTSNHIKSYDYTLPQHCYTFCHYKQNSLNGNLYDVGDYSINHFVGRCMNNVIREYKQYSVQYINKLVLAQRVGMNHDGFYNNDFSSSSNSIINVTWSTGAYDNNIKLEKSYIGVIQHSQGSIYNSYINHVYDDIDISCNDVYADTISNCRITLTNAEVSTLGNCNGSVSRLYGSQFTNCSFNKCSKIYVCEGFNHNIQVDNTYGETLERVVYEVNRLLDLEDVKFGSNIRDLVLLTSKYIYNYNYPCIIDNSVRSTDKVNLLDGTSDTGTYTAYIPKQIHISTYRDEGRYDSNQQRKLHVPTYYISQSTSGDIIMTTVDDVINNVNTVSTTYEELVKLRDAAKLIPGCAYRITDYQTIIDDINATSAGHQFDLIVTALDKQTLSEEASAIQHNGDTYFTNSKLDAWKIWYSLDNDKSRFDWASVGEVTGTKFTAFYWNDPTFGEEYDNISNSTDLICDYDTEYDDILEKDNIVIYKTGISYYLSEGVDYQDKWFYRGEITIDGDTYDSWQKWDAEWNGFYNKDGNSLFALTNRIVNQDGSVNLPQISIKEPGKGVIYRMIDEFGNDCPYDFKNIKFKHPDTNKDTNFYYTFSEDSNGNVDKSLWKGTCFNNKIEAFGYMYASQTSTTSALELPRNIFIGKNNRSNYIADNVLDGRCQNNVFGYGCLNNKLESVSSVTFGDACLSNSLGDCFGITLPTGSCYNTFTRCKYIKPLYNVTPRAILHSTFKNCDHFDINETIEFCSFSDIEQGLKNMNFPLKSCIFKNSENASFSFDCSILDDIILFHDPIGGVVVEQYYTFHNDGTEMCTSISLSNSDIMNVTYAGLKKLMNKSYLKPGYKYCIIDYVTTTSQKDTMSAGHKFNIIVTANSPSILSEEAKVCPNENETYFDDANLNAWEIKYCIDNDTQRFAWAGDEGIQTVEVEAVNSSNCTISVGYNYDEEEGLNKFDERIHFISQMWDDPTNDPYVEGDKIDELITHWGYEEDPYGIEDCLTLYGLNLEIDEETGEITSEDGLSSDRWYYRGVITVDGTDYDYWEKAEWGVNTGDFGYMDKEYSEKLFFLTNRIVSGEPTIETITQETVIPLEPKGVIYYMKDEHGNEAPYDFKNIMFKYWVSSIDSNYAYTFSSVNNYTLIDSSVYPSCYNNKIDKYISNGLYKLPNNIFCNNDRIDTCYGNVLGLNCYNNEFGGSCYFNRFGDNCYDNRLKYGCAKNSFGNNCYGNLLAKNSTNNSFGVSCSYNRLGENAISNSFGNLCSYNEFGDYCKSNSFGNQCHHNVFYSKTPMSTLPAKYVVNCHVDDGCEINKIVADNYNTTKKLKNLHVRRGVSDINWISQPLTLLDANYEITVAKNSKGEIKVYCEADLIS